MFISKDDKFELHAKGVTVGRRSINSGYFRNKITGVNCGKHIKIKKYHFNEAGEELQVPIIDEDCYEVIKDEY